MLKNYSNSNIFWLMVDKIQKITVSYLLFLLITHSYDVATFGEYSFSLTIIGFLVLISNLGLRNIIVDEVLKRNYSARILMSSAIFSQLLMATVICIITYIIILMVPIFSSTEKNIMLILVASLVVRSTDFIYAFFEAKVNLSRLVVCNSIVSMVVFLCKVFLILQGYPIEILAITLSIELSLIWLSSTILLLKEIKTVKVKTLISKKLIQRSWPLIVSGGVGLLFIKTDLILVRWLLSAEEVGVYAVAMRLAEGWFLIIFVLINALSPTIFNTEDHAVVSTNHLKVMKRLVALCYIVMLIVFLISDTIFLLLFPITYSESIGIFKILVVASLFVMFGALSGRYFIYLNRQTLNMWRVVLGLIINLVMGYISIQWLGVIGAAYSTLIAYFFAAFLFDLLLPETRDLFKLKCTAMVKCIG